MTTPKVDLADLLPPDAYEQVIVSLSKILGKNNGRGDVTIACWNGQVQVVRETVSHDVGKELQ